MSSLARWQLNEWGGYGRTSPADRGLTIPPSMFPQLWPHWFVEQARIRRDARRSSRRVQMIVEACRTLDVEGKYPL